MAHRRDLSGRTQNAPEHAPGAFFLLALLHPIGYLVTGYSGDVYTNPVTV